MSSISVVLATYNGERYLSQQLRSVLTQLESSDEIIIVDDSSTDKTPELLRELSDPRVKIYFNSVNSGVRHSFEQALSIAQNEIVFLCDQDDIWLPGKRRAFVSAFDSDQKIQLVISDAIVIDAQGDLVSASFMSTRGGFSSSIWATLYKNRYLGCCMAMRRSLVDRGLPIPETVPMHDMWFGMLAATHPGQVFYIDQPYLKYRRHSSNASPNRRASWHVMTLWRWRLLWAWLGALSR